MRIVIFGTEYIESSVIDLANSLSKSCEVILITSSESFPEEYCNFLSENILVKRFSMPRMRNPKSFFVIRDIVKKIISFKPDILHIQSNGHVWFFSALDMLRRLNIVNTIHDSRQHLGDQQSRGNYLLNMIGKLYTNRYTTHTVHQKILLSKIIKVHAEKIDVVPLAGHSIYSRINNKNFSEKKNSLLFFGRIWPYKGLDFLIKIAPLISAVIPDLKIIVAGRGEDIDQYKNMIKNKDTFKFVNHFIDVKDVSGFFQRASIIVIPYKEATQSGLVPLAYSFSKPVVATNVGGLPEQIQDGIHGFLVPSGNEKYFAFKVLQLLTNDKLRFKLGKNAKKFYDTTLSEDVISSRLMKTYKKTLESINKT